jgi:ACR3 family arsenite efflux pump ArsB
MIGNATPFLDQFLQHYLCLVIVYQPFLCLWWSSNNMVDDIVFHNLNLPLAHQLSNLILEILTTIYISYLDYTI